MYIMLTYVGLLGVAVGGICWRIYHLETRNLLQLERREAHLTAIRLKAQMLKSVESPDDSELPWSYNPLFSEG